MISVSDILLGQPAVYTKITSRYDNSVNKMVEVGRELFRGKIAAFCVLGHPGYAAVVMLYDDGSLHAHQIGEVTLESPITEGPFR